MRTLLAFFLAATAAAQTAPQSNTATIDPDGTARITRVIPVPENLSPEARALVARRPGPDAPTLAERRARTDAFRTARSKQALQLYPVTVAEKVIAGVRTDLITPLNLTAQNKARVLINVHGGGFNADSGSLVEGIPIANLTGIPVVSVYYRLAPEHPFPAAVDDTVAVYKALLKTHSPAHIALFGTSAGAILTAQTAVRLRQLNLPLPAALGIFSGTGDMLDWNDARALYTLSGFGGTQPLKPIEPSPYVGNTDRKDPVLSPLYAGLKAFPPSLLITSGRDILLSGTVDLHRALLRARVPAELVVFDALPHAFWYNYELPETREALDIMSRFFLRILAR